MDYDSNGSIAARRCSRNRSFARLLVSGTRNLGKARQPQRELTAEVKAVPAALIIEPGTINIRADRDRLSADSMI